VTDEVVGQVRLRLDLAYDGTEFHGWAAQLGTRTVQGTVQSALELVFRSEHPHELTVAGRTDAGVHARGQVAHLDVDAGIWALSGPNALRRLNRILPADVRVHSIDVAPPGFDARFSALARHYTYRVADDQARLDPLRRRDTLWHRASLDPAKMNEAAALCLGERDFAAFCRRRPGATTIRELQRLDWQPTKAGVLVGTFVADAFCHNMVRAITGALLAVGDGTRPATWIADVLAAGVRDPSVRVALPHGLCLEHVSYPPPADLIARAHLTRRLRA
jgi:tRNA pseudouridine38-40 synthase